MSFTICTQTANWRRMIAVLGALLAVTMLASSAGAQCGTLFGECLGDANLDLSIAGADGSAGASPSWMLSNGGNDTAAQYQPGFADTTGVNGVWYRAFLGNEENGGVDADLSQTVVVPTAGTYRVTFDYLVEEFFTASSMTASLSSSGGPADTIDLLSAARTSEGGGFSGNPAQIGDLELPGVIPGDALTVSVAMVGGMNAGMNPQSVVVDNFSLRRVPEPGSLVLVLLCLCGLVGFRGRR